MNTTTNKLDAGITAQAGQFMDAMFAPGDCIVFRPIETWTEGGRKRSRVDFKAIEHRYLGIKNRKGEWAPWPDGLANLIRALQKRAEEKRTNMFFGVCPRFGGNGQYDLAWQIRVVRVLWADVDDCQPDAAVQRCREANLPDPSIVVNSGHGGHLYWLLDAPYMIDDVGDPSAVVTAFIDQGKGHKKKVRKYLKDGDTGDRLYLDAKQNVPPLSFKAQHMQDVLAGIAAKIGGDHTQDLSRLMRLPGTLNRKDERNGKQPVPCGIVNIDLSRRHSLSVFEKFAELSPGKKRRSEIAKVKLPAHRKLSPTKQDRFNESVMTCRAAEVGSRSEADFALCCFAVESGMREKEVWSKLQGVGKFAEGGERYFQRTWEAAKNHSRVKIFERVQTRVSKMSRAEATRGRGDPTNGRPEIVVDTDEPRVIDEVISALAVETNLYQRAGMLAHVVRDAPPPRGIARPKDAPRIAPLRLPRLRELMAAAAKWMRPVGKEGFEPCHPPDWAVKAVDARGQWSGIQRLEGVVEAPVLRADGTVLQKAGYDEPTGLLYEATGEFPAVPESPTLSQAQEACNLLLQVVADFPVASGAHRSAWIAGVLTPLARFAVHGAAPLFLLDANVRGCGKSLLTDVIAIIVSGRPMARMTVPRDDDELRKRITALAVAGESLVLIDNIAGTLGSPSLDAALTATTWSDRILGRTEMVTGIPLTATWYGTGNNVILAADTARRTLHIRLECPEERPEERSNFRHPHLLQWVRHERPRLTTAAATILRAYCAAGRPDMKLKPWGSFEEWSDLVRQALAWCGLPDPGETRIELTAQADHEGNALRLLIAGLEEADPTGEGLTSTAILRLLEDNQDRSDTLRNAIAELVPARGGKAPSSRSLGMKLHHLRRRVVGAKLLDKKDTRSGAVWYVASAENCGTSGTSGTNSIPYVEGIDTSIDKRAHIEGVGNSLASSASPAPPAGRARPQSNVAPVTLADGSEADQVCLHHDRLVERVNGRAREVCRTCGKFYGYRNDRSAK